MTLILWAIVIAGALSIVYGIVTTRGLMAADAGSARMQEISAAVREGASAYLRRQYTTIAIVGVVIVVLAWWLLGVSLVATTFSTDTPNLVTDMVRTGGVSQNWSWWAFLITGMCTVFFYARMWRRSEVMTDLGFYEIRYSGRPAAFLRGFRAVYLGVFFNVMIMARVNLAAMKISGVLLGYDRATTIFVCSAVTVLYAASSGLRGVVLTDVVQFGIAMIGSVAAAWYALSLPQIGGLSGLLAHPEVARRVSFLPDFGDWRNALMVLIIPIAVQWWSTWYPGAEPGGGGYVAQRMLAASLLPEARSSRL